MAGLFISYLEIDAFSAAAVNSTNSVPVDDVMQRFYPPTNESFLVSRA